MNLFYYLHLFILLSLFPTIIVFKQRFCWCRILKWFHHCENGKKYEQISMNKKRNMKIMIKYKWGKNSQSYVEAQNSHWEMNIWYSLFFCVFLNDTHFLWIAMKCAPLSASTSWNVWCFTNFFRLVKRFHCVSNNL